MITEILAIYGAYKLLTHDSGKSKDFTCGHCGATMRIEQPRPGEKVRCWLCKMVSTLDF